MLQLVANNYRPYDSREPDAYLLHLAEVNNFCSVSASIDILNNRGVVLIKRGTPISLEIVNAIYQSRLATPIHDSIVIENQLDSRQLELDLLGVMQGDDFLAALHEHQNLEPLIQPYLVQFQQYNLIHQKLTVMKVTMPEFYARGLLTTWLSLLLAKEMKFSEKDSATIFLAALSHDIGMLHVNLQVLSRKEKLSAEDWKHIQSHVGVGVTLLQTIPEISADTIEAVAEHHERCDGTGYPLGKVESEISFAGKIVGLADSVIAIYRNRFKAERLSWRDIIPIIQMNAQAYFYRHDEILATIWRRGEMPFKNVVAGDELPKFLADLLQQHDRLNQCFEALRNCLLTIGFTHGDRRLHSLQNVMLHLTTTVKGSGIFSDELMEWLKNVDVNNINEDYKNITKAHVQQQEIIFNLQRLLRMLQIYIDSGECKTTEIQSALITAMDQVKAWMK